MAPAVKKARTKRKRRTEEISSASSSSEDESVASPPPKVAHKQSHPSEPVSASTSTSEAEDDVPQQAMPVKPIVSAEQSFEDFYLRQATKEFANDLEKLRNASDFSARSVPVLIDALRQGKSCLSQDERTRIGAASAGS